MRKSTSIIFLIGLNDHYEAIRAQLLAHTPLPMVDSAYQTVINTEWLRVKDGKKESVVAFKVDSKYTPVSGVSDKLFCQHCNREGHDKDTCYQLIGFSEWWDDRRKGSRGPGRGGHEGRGGRGGRGGGTGSQVTVCANAVQGGGPEASNSNSGSNVQSSTQGLVGVSSDQAQQIVDLLTKSKSRLEG